MTQTESEPEKAEKSKKPERKFSASEMISLAVFGLSVFTLTGLLFYNPVEYFAREATRHPREVPFLFARLLYSNLGLASYLIVVFAAVWSAAQFFREHVRAIGLKAFGIVLLGCSVATLAGSIAASGGDGARLESGGIVGTFLSERLQELVGPIGLYAVLLLFLGVSLIFVTDWFFVSLFRRTMPAFSGFGGMTPTLIAIAPVPDEDRSEPTPTAGEVIFRTLQPRREPAPSIDEPPDAAPDVDLSDISVEVVSPEEPVTEPLTEPMTARFIDRASEAAPAPAAEVERPSRRFESASAETETDEDREIEVDPEHLIFDDDNDDGPTQFIILDGDPEDSEWVEMENAGGRASDDQRTVAEILGEIAEPVTEGETDADEESEGIEVEIELAEAALPVPSPVAEKAPETEPVVAEPIARFESRPGTEVESDVDEASSEAETPRTAVTREPEPAPRCELPADAERVESLTRELARERDAAPASAESDSETAEVGGPREEALYKDAVRVVVESRRGSVSLLQRRLEVGYARATKFLERMEREGIVGPYEGAKARDVLVTLEEWDTLSS